ncbi:MAG TPA: NADP-dependent oxidoreductase [Pseudonocardia sp.]|nr:NADP-dependent oxidoreductase [Pseudonocardia sp.]
MSSAIVATDFGGIEVLAAVEVDVPAPGPGEVTVQVRAAGVNPVDYKLFSGTFGPADRSALPLPVGREVAGVVTAVGPDATGPAGPLSVGDEVVVFPAVGGYAEQLTVSAAAAVPKPEGLSWVDAAGLLLAGATAVHAIAAVGGVGEGDTVLVHGASGSVGQLVVQLAARAGATVVGTAAERNHPLLKELGATAVVYGPGLAERVITAVPGPITAAVDTVGTEEAIDVSLALLANPDRLVTIAAAREGVRRIGGGAGADQGREIRANAWRTLLPLAEAGELKLVVARTYPLAQAADALRFVRDGHAAGKVILLPDASGSSS